MVLINPPPPALDADTLSLFYATDELLSASPALVFYGSSATATALPTNSRIQVHIYTAAGFHSFPRLTVVPSSATYSAVECLAREEQGDEICRTLAYSLYKYFSELPEGIRNTWERRSSSQLPSAPPVFSAAHAAILASRMTKVDNVSEIVEDVKNALTQQALSWIDVDVVVPADSMLQISENPRESNLFEASDDDTTNQRYGEYAPLVKLFGQPAFLPTTTLKRAPSRPTALNRTLTFTGKQKENLRKEMIELLDTEENYVEKMQDLLHNVAEEYRQKARRKDTSSASPSEQALKKLFPPCLDEILQVNTAFLDTIRQILDDSEDDAIRDLQGTPVDPEKATTETNGIDLTGASAIADCLVQWFPKFSGCYGGYIQAHAGFSGYLKSFTREIGTSFTKRVQELGEQRLMSMLIEPVQRLPRYNLYIDNIVKNLPMRHPALKPFLKARDIISEICSQESPGSQLAKIIHNLRSLVASLPLDFQPRGRLITAVDVTELEPPYRTVFQGSNAKPGIIVLFTDRLVVLHKASRRSTNARNLLSELNGSEASKSTTSGQVEPSLEFHKQFNLGDIFVSEANSSRMVHILESPKQGTATAEGNGTRMFHLSMHYEGRAAKFVEEFIKARVEGRFSEQERDSHKWEVRSVSGDLSLFSAVFEETSKQAAPDRARPASVRILIEPSKMIQPTRHGEDGIELVASLQELGDGLFLLDIHGANGFVYHDRVTAVEFCPHLIKRLSNFFQMRNQIRNPALTATFLARNQQILNNLTCAVPNSEADRTAEPSVRSASPVKMLSNLFGGSSREPSSLRKSRPFSALYDGPRFTPSSNSRPQSRDSESTSRPQSAGLSIAGTEITQAAASLAKLEDTLNSYLLALDSRKGNVVGKIIRNRAAADKLAVSELYNSLLEDPANHEAVANLPLDIVFSAFENFIKLAWKEAMGPLIPRSTLIAIQSKSDSSHPGEFEEFFRKVFSDISPQNQRALFGIVKLLANLLDGTANDSDRGILTAFIAEVLVSDGNAHDFISLIDRFVEDMDPLFSAPEPPASSKGSISSESRFRLGNTGSLTSNTSSFRKKLGFGSISRENSKSESESKFGSVLRTLSKTTRGESNRGDNSQPSSLSKGSLVRSRSTDIDGRTSPKRPVSRDRQAVLGTFPFEDDTAHSGRSFLGLSSLDTIGEIPPGKQPPRKKRRSSLSDLKTLQASGHNTPTWSPQTPRRPGYARQLSASPATPTRGKGSFIPTPSTQTPLTGRASPIKENALGSPQRQHFPLKPTVTSIPGDGVVITSRNPTKRRNDSMSGIPTLKAASTAPPALSERPSSGNTSKLPALSDTKPSLQSTSPTKKLRMQSPQKLRERLQREQKAISTTTSLLQDELSKIGDELASHTSSSGIPSPTRSARSNTIHSSPTKSLSISSPSLTPIIARVATLESKLSTLITENSTRMDAIAADVASSLQVTDTKARKLDELYREANAENEALYARFNAELEKVLKGVRAGEGVDELKSALRKSQEEAEKSKRETARLKREVLGLRAQLKE